MNVLLTEQRVEEIVEEVEVALAVVESSKEIEMEDLLVVAEEIVIEVTEVIEVTVEIEVTVATAAPREALGASRPSFVLPRARRPERARKRACSSAGRCAASARTKPQF